MKIDRVISFLLINFFSYGTIVNVSKYKKFSFFKDFNQNTEELSSNEQEFLEEIFDQIILDIFNASVANW